MYIHAGMYGVHHTVCSAANSFSVEDKVPCIQVEASIQLNKTSNLV